MFGFNGNTGDIALLALVALGTYANCHDLNLANNTTIMLLLFATFLEHEEVRKLDNEVCCVERFTGTTGCKCGFNNSIGRFSC